MMYEKYVTQAICDIRKQLNKILKEWSNLEPVLQKYSFTGVLQELEKVEQRTSEIREHIGNLMVPNGSMDTNGNQSVLSTSSLAGCHLPSFYDSPTATPIKLKPKESVSSLPVRKLSSAQISPGKNGGQTPKTPTKTPSDVVSAKSSTSTTSSALGHVSDIWE